jgi:ATP synthase protein I
MESMADDPKPSPDAGTVRDLAKAQSMMQLGFAVPVGCFVGILLGTWLDRHFHQHWMTITGLFLGAGGGFVHIFTALARMTKRGDT